MPPSPTAVATSPDSPWYSIEEVAQRLSLHPRTVRNHVRDGRLQATRVGKQYRISSDALERYIRPPNEPSMHSVDLRADVSAVVHISGGDPVTAQRLAQAVLSTLSSGAGHNVSRVETVLDPDRGELRLIILAPPAEAAALLTTIATLVEALQNDLHKTERQSV